jgi:hypothetical protein
MVVELGDIQLCGTRSLLSGIYFGMIEGEVGEYVKSQVESNLNVGLFGLFVCFISSHAHICNSCANSLSNVRLPGDNRHPPLCWFTARQWFWLFRKTRSGSSKSSETWWNLWIFAIWSPPTTRVVSKMHLLACVRRQRASGHRPLKLGSATKPPRDSATANGQATKLKQVLPVASETCQMRIAEKSFKLVEICNPRAKVQHKLLENRFCGTMKCSSLLFRSFCLLTWNRTLVGSSDRC